MKLSKISPGFFLCLGLLGCPSDPEPSADTTADGTGTTGMPGMADDGTTGGSNPGTETGEPATDSSGAADTDTGDPPGTDSGSTGSDESTGGSGSSGGDESTGTTGVAGDLPDLDMSVVVDDTTNSIYTQTINFTKDDCAFQNGCLGGTGPRRLLRFDTITPNLGPVDFHVGNPTDNPELFEMSACGGWLFSDYARYRLLDGDGNEVGNGHKAAFALIDLVPFTDDAGPAQYGFGADMGISVGWADVYNAGLDCQWVDITDVPAGDYMLELSINPDEVVAEATFDNNILQVPVTVVDEDDVEGPPPEWICDADFYGASDGCDCGCGAHDPDCPDESSAGCMYCDPPGCAMSCDDIDPVDHSSCI